MQNFFATCLALGILGGGFVLTGDLGRLAARGLRVIQATDVPDDDAPIPVAAPEGPAGPTTPLPAPAFLARPVPRHVGPELIDLAAVQPGERILVWLSGAAEPLAVDVIDPAASAVILHHGTPQRAAIDGGTLRRGGTLMVVPLGLAHAGATAAPESLGEVTGLRIDR